MNEKNIFSRTKMSPPKTAETLNFSRISGISHRIEFSSTSESNIFTNAPQNMVPYPPRFIEGAQNSEPHFDEFENEPSILEELDIDIQAVKSKLRSTIFFFKPDPEFAQKPDLTGPLILATILGLVLVLVKSKERKNQLWFYLRVGIFRLCFNLHFIEFD